MTYADRNSMPYTYAVCTEMQRFRNVAVATLFHCPSEDVTVLGVNIPKGRYFLGLNDIYLVENICCLFYWHA